MILRRQSDKVDVLKKVPLFRGLSKRHLDRVARHADEVEIDADEVLTRQGELGRELLIIIEGRARIEMDRKVIGRLGPGDFVGEMSVIDGKPRSASVIAEVPTAALVIEGRAFAGLLEDVPGLNHKILVGLCERLREADAKIAARN